jgi:hypothetical protein
MYDPWHDTAFDATIAGDRDLQCPRFGRLDIGNMAAPAANLARSGNSRFRRFNSRFGQKNSRLSAYGNSPASDCFCMSFSFRIEACRAKIAKIPGYFRFYGNLANRSRAADRPS